MPRSNIKEKNILNFSIPSESKTHKSKEFIIHSLKNIYSLNYYYNQFFFFFLNERVKGKAIQHFLLDSRQIITSHTEIKHLHSEEEKIISHFRIKDRLILNSTQNLNN